MEDFSFWADWLRFQVRARVAGRDEAGFTAVEWLVIAMGVIAIAGVAVAAVQAYVTGQANKLSAP